MHCEQHLALAAVIAGLRRSGAIDKRCVAAIVDVLRETADRVEPQCGDTSEGLLRLADVLAAGPSRSCRVSIAA